MRFHFLLFYVPILFLCSCVSNQKFAILQKDDLRPKKVVLDTTVRVYELDTFAYRIQANDIVSVRFESLTAREFDMFNNQYSNNLAMMAGQLQGGGALLMGEIVDEHGEIPVSYIGKFKIGGLTVFEAQNKLQAIALQNGLQAPTVRVRLLNYRVTFLGEVNREGTTFLAANRVSMLEAVGLAGGFGELADRSRVKLIRQVGNNTEVVYLNFLDENFFKSPYFYAYQNDILVVPPLQQRPYRKYFGQNLSLVISTVSVILLTLNLLRN